MRKFMFAMVVILVSIGGSAKDVISGRVVTVIDGNTVEVTTADSETYIIMLHEIDCPELGQKFGEQAKRFLEKLLLDKPVSVEMKGKNRWGTRFGIIMIDGELDPRYELLEAGLAWTTEVNPNPEFEELKERAKENGRGLWREDTPTPPWKFRRQQTLTQFKSN